MRKSRIDRLKSLYEVFSNEGVYLTMDELEKIDESISLDKYFEIINKIAKNYLNTEKRRRIYTSKERGAFYKQSRVKRERKAVHKCSKISGRIVATFESVSIAAQHIAGDTKFKGNISNCCNEKIPSYLGWKWVWAQ